jgi:hypothetical protein
MSDKSKKNIHLVSGIATSALLIVTGLLLIISCVSVYRLGNRPFTVENISAAFAKISIPVYVTIAAVLADMVLQLVFPRDERRIKATLNKRVTAARLEKKLDRALCTKELLTLIDKEKKKLLFLRLALITFGIVQLAIFAIFALNLQNYTLEYNESVIAICLSMLPSVLLMAGASIAFTYSEDHILGKLIGHLKAAISSGARRTSNDVTVENNTHKWAPRIIMGARILILAVAVFFIIEGISNGGASDVFIKAINICTECIGLG